MQYGTTEWDTDECLYKEQKALAENAKQNLYAKYYAGDCKKYCILAI